MSILPMLKTRTSFLRPMLARVDEGHRPATPLELLFDLVSVIAIAAAAGGLHHAIAENHVAAGLLGFSMAFCSIWWAWMQFTWFATSYDNDDVFYRIAILVMMTGSLILAAGIKSMFSDADFSYGIIGYVIMRLAHVSLLLRVARHNPTLRVSALATAVGIIVCQAGWIIGFQIVAPAMVPVYFAIMLLAELSVPAIVARFADIPWHKHHIAERYGLLTIIVLGESLFALSGAIEKLGQYPDLFYQIIFHIIGGLVTLFGMWWVYFGEDNHRALDSYSTTFLWGYVHLFIFASIAAFGAGLGVNFDYITHYAHIGEIGARASMAIPAAVFLFSVWLVHDRFNASRMLHNLALPTCALLIVASIFTPIFGYLLPALMVIAAIFSSHTRNSQAQNA